MDFLFALLISIASQFGISQDEAIQTDDFQSAVDQQLRDGLITDNDVNTANFR